MKKFLIIEAVLFVLGVMIPDEDISALFGFAVVLCPIVFGIITLVRKLKPKPIENVPVVQTPQPQWRYLWLLKEDQKLGNKFEKWYRENLTENDEYFKSNKTLKDYYYDQRIYEYEPYELPFKIEGNKVFSYMKENEWGRVGYIKENDQESLENASVTKLCLMSNRYKRVGDNYVQKESGDAYFGLKILN